MVLRAAWQTDFSAGRQGDVGLLPMEILYSQHVFIRFIVVKTLTYEKRCVLSVRAFIELLISAEGLRESVFLEQFTCLAG